MVSCSRFTGINPQSQPYTFLSKIVVLAARMQVFGDSLLEEISTSDRRSGVQLINLHPVLPDAFDGMRPTDRAYEAFQKEEITKSEMTVHRVVRV
ncbi:hypothetical protein BDN71DRAFT_1452161 [Pleurotus eryngii]|uniref:Uncharacterized protein n=1 Tax=Pleurotus eryngii TaxID=5323 RepID=A0A9P5ZPP3_PLEER|nr:hypothetical protein BDN71DRAFT_1452161 [Pleurotus eryngii]